MNFFKHKKKNNRIIIILFFSFILLIGCLTFKDYGISIDEEFSRSSGLYWLAQILENTPFNEIANQATIRFNDIKGMSLLTAKDFPMYGIVFDVPFALIEVLANIESSQNYFYLRHFGIFFTFFLSSIFFYKILKNRFNNFNISLIGTCFYILSPRIYGASFYNNKDILFLSLVTITLYFCFEALDKKNYKTIILFALFSALCTSTRIIAIFFPLSFVLIFFLSNYMKINKLKIVYILSYYIFFYFLFIFLHWPYLWDSPFQQFFMFLISAQNLLNETMMLFNGEYINSKFLPYYYIPVWIIISTPTLYIIFFFYGLLNQTIRLFRRFFNIKENSTYPDFWRSKNEEKDFYILFNFLVIIFYLIIFNITLYNSWRQIYFINTFIIYISTYGIFILFSKLKSKTRKNYFNLIIGILITGIVYKMVVYHPYQNIYFNSLVSNKFKNNFEVDYMGTSGVRFLEKILDDNIEKQKIYIGVASYLPIERSLSLIDAEKRSRINIVGQEYDKADFIYTNYTSEVDKKYNKKYDIPKNFKKIDEFIIDGTKIYEVYKKQ